MESKKFTSTQIAQIKRTAQNVAKYTTQKERLLAKINQLKAELEMTQGMIDGWQGPIKLMTGGFTTEELINRVVTHTDKDGKEATITKYELKYPETVLPVEKAAVEESEDLPHEPVEIPTQNPSQY